MCMYLLLRYRDFWLPCWGNLQSYLFVDIGVRLVVQGMFMMNGRTKPVGWCLI